MTIERAAKAICRAEGDDPDSPHHVHDETWRSYEATARAALYAIYKPLPEMNEAGKKAYNDHIVNSREGDCFSAIWRAMHRAMMKETK